MTPNGITSQIRAFLTQSSEEKLSPAADRNKHKEACHQTGTLEVSHLSGT